ncbi:hypothetical protein [Teichococcus vastitatis]|uniref:hypothetical protein n=1 Tax=Teichococcus vastitatis TaxID=2307076 RepID=UPI000E734A27|nr:hypothetical protein [Pseudoroseomonas vastitatis]
MKTEFRMDQIRSPRSAEEARAMMIQRDKQDEGIRMDAARSPEKIISAQQARNVMMRRGSR